MSDTYKVNESLPTTDKIELLNDMIMTLDGQIDQAKFNKNEIEELYSGAGFERKYLRDISLGHTLSNYTNWSHLKAEAGFSIWKIAPSNYEYDAKNQLYFDNKVLTNKGEASTESASTFSLVYLYDGSSYIDDTTEAGTEAGTAFSLMTGASSFLYLGSSTTFKGAKFEFATRGSNYDLQTEIFCSGSSADNWVGLTACDDYDDDTSNFESDGNIEWSLTASGADWRQTAVNSQTKYWARIKTTTVPVTTAKANYIIPSSSVIGLLALSSSEILNEEWAWCTYDTDIYVTIRNTGATAYEGDYYVTSTSSATNLQNYFVYNHEYKLDHVDSRLDYNTFNIFKTIKISPTVYDDIMMPALNLKPGTTPPAFTAFKNGIYGYSFINAQSDELHGACEIPHTYKEGTDLLVHVHWSPSSTNTGNCVWTFEYSKTNQGTGTFPTSDTLTASIDIAGSGTIGKHQYTPIGTISGAGIKVGDVIAYRIARPAGDSFTGDAFMHNIGIHYQVDTLGSRTELVK